MLSQEHQNLVRIASLYMQSPWGACRQTANYFSLAATWEFLLVAVAHQVHYKNNLHEPGWVSNQFFGGRMGSIDHQGQEELYLWSEVMKFRQHHPQFSPSPVHSIANHLSFHPSIYPSIQPFIHPLALPIFIWFQEHHVLLCCFWGLDILGPVFPCIQQCHLNS